MRDIEVADGREQTRGNTRVRGAVAGPNPKPLLPGSSPFNNILALQSLAGNRTVTALVQRKTLPGVKGDIRKDLPAAGPQHWHREATPPMAPAMEPSIQRCGPIPCNCDSDERERADGAVQPNVSAP